MSDDAFRQLAARLHRHGARCTTEFLLAFGCSRLCRPGLETELRRWVERLDELDHCGALDATGANRPVRSPLYLVRGRSDA